MNFKYYMQKAYMFKIFIEIQLRGFTICLFLITAYHRRSIEILSVRVDEGSS